MPTSIVVHVTDVLLLLLCSVQTTEEVRGRAATSAGAPTSPTLSPEQGMSATRLRLTGLQPVAVGPVGL